MGLLNKKNKETKTNDRKTLSWIYKRTKKHLPLVGVISVLAAIDSSTFVLLALISKNILDVATGNLESTILKQGIYLFAVIAIQIITLVFHSLLNTYFSETIFGSTKEDRCAAICSVVTSPLIPSIPRSEKKTISSLKFVAFTTHPMEMLE